mgnify:CR=1 FL=1
MSYRTLIRRSHPMRVAASAMLDADRALEEIQRQFNRYPAARLGAPGAFVPRLNAVENEGEYVVSAELPGVAAESLDVAIDEGILTIKGHREVVAHAHANEDGVEEQAPAAESFERRVRFNGEIDEEAVKARYKNGLLTVTLPKPAAAEPEIRSIPVEVS